MSHVHYILKDPYYTGVVTFKGEVFPGRHEPLITKELFDHVQAIIADRRGAGTKERVHQHYLRGLLRCMRCAQRGIESRLIYTESVGRGGDKHLYYFCIERQQNRACNLPYLPVWQVEERMVDVLDQVQITESFAEDIRLHLGEALANEQTSLQIARQQLNKEMQVVLAKEERLLDFLAEGTLSRDIAQKKINELVMKKTSVQQRLDQNETKLEQGVEILQELVSLMLKPKQHYDIASDDFRRAALQTYFQHIYVGDDDEYRGKIREPFASIRKANQIFGFPQSGGQTDVSAERPGTFPPLENVHSIRTDQVHTKTAQNADFGVPNGTFGGKRK